jgi:hypothetical protein
LKRPDFKIHGFIALAVLRELGKGPVHGYALLTKFEEMHGFKPLVAVLDFCGFI